MKINLLKMTLLCGVFFFYSFYSYARRKPPVKVEPVYTKNFKIIPLRHKISDDDKLFGGVIGIYSRKTGRLLWWLRVYRVEYTKGLESDIQNIYINKIVVEKDGTLRIENELNMLFKVNLVSKTVKLLKDYLGKGHFKDKIKVSGEWKKADSPNPNALSKH